MPKLDLGLPKYDSLFSTEEERQESKLEKIVSIPIDKISDFKNHPFHVIMDEDMLKLIDSIKENGILIPALVRPKDDGTCTNWQDIKRPKHAFKLFLRFIIARGLVMYGMELMTGIFEIVQGIVSTITHTVGLGTAESTVIPQEIIDAVNNTGFLESIPLWAVTLLGSIFITILSFIMILTVYGRFFKIYMYTAISPIPLAAAAGESTQNTTFTFIKSYACVYLEGAIILLSCVIFSAFASSAPAIDTSASAVSMIWSYIGELIFNMLVLVGTIKMSDRIVKEMTGL